MSCEDEEIFESVYTDLTHYYDTVGSEEMFVDIKDDLVQIVLNKLALPEDEAYIFVCMWFDNRH